MKLLQPDIDEVQSAIKRYQQQGNTKAAKVERGKLQLIRKNHGIY